MGFSGFLVFFVDVSFLRVGGAFLLLVVGVSFSYFPVCSPR
jgi:hypothetical protein